MPIALKKYTETAHKQKESDQCNAWTLSATEIKQDFKALVLKLLCKTPNEAAVVSLGFYVAVSHGKIWNFMGKQVCHFNLEIHLVN